MVAHLTALQEGGVGRQTSRRNQRIQEPVCLTCHQRRHVRQTVLTTMSATTGAPTKT